MSCFSIATHRWGVRVLDRCTLLNHTARSAKWSVLLLCDEVALGTCGTDGRSFRFHAQLVMQVRCLCFPNKPLSKNKEMHNLSLIVVLRKRVGDYDNAALRHQSVTFHYHICFFPRRWRCLRASRANCRLCAKVRVGMMMVVKRRRRLSLMRRTIQDGTISFWLSFNNVYSIFLVSTGLTQPFLAHGPSFQKISDGPCCCWYLMRNLTRFIV